MKNQKLFDKIRDSLTQDSAELPDWDREAVWGRIQMKKQPQRNNWWPYISAASIVLCVLVTLIYLQKSVNTKTQHADLVPRLRNQSEKINIATNTSKIKIAVKTKTILLNKNPKRSFQDDQIEVIAQQVFNSHPRVVDSTYMAKVIIVPENTTDKSVLENINEKVAVFTSQDRVLVVNIDLPEAAPEAPITKQTNFRERLHNQTARLKTERKFDFKALDRNSGNGIWSFVGQSFVTPNPK